MMKFYSSAVICNQDKYNECYHLRPYDNKPKIETPTASTVLVGGEPAVSVQYPAIRNQAFISRNNSNPPFYLK